MHPAAFTLIADYFFFLISIMCPFNLSQQRFLNIFFTGHLA